MKEDKKIKAKIFVKFITGHIFHDRYYSYKRLKINTLVSTYKKNLINFTREIRKVV